MERKGWRLQTSGRRYRRCASLKVLFTVDREMRVKHLDLGEEHFHTIWPPYFSSMVPMPYKRPAPTDLTANGMLMVLERSKVGTIYPY